MKDIRELESLRLLHRMSTVKQDLNFYKDIAKTDELINP